MKKTLSFLLCIAMLLSITGCNDADGTRASGRKRKSNIITNAWGYSNGYMFVQFDNSNEETYCIDKKGKIVFTLDGNYSCVIGFHNDIAAVQECESKEIYLCDISGNLIAAEDVGGTAFMLDSSEIIVNMFKDGYIPVKQTTTSYTGSTDKLGIIDPSLNFITEFDESFYEDFYESGYSAMALSWYGYVEIGEYYDGYIFITNSYGGGSYIDLRTGEISRDILEMYYSINLKNKSDMWRIEREFYKEELYFYDIRDNSERFEHTSVMDLDIYFDTIKFPCGYFDDGYCPVIMEVEDSNTGTEYFFGIIKENIENRWEIFCFEPVNLNCHYEPEVYRANDKFLVTSGARFVIFDTQGVITDKDVYLGTIMPELFSDDVIIVCDDDKYFPCTLDFEPLF